MGALKVGFQIGKPEPPFRGAKRLLRFLAEPPEVGGCRGPPPLAGVTSQRPTCVKWVSLVMSPGHGERCSPTACTAAQMYLSRRPPVPAHRHFQAEAFGPATGKAAVRLPPTALEKRFIFAPMMNYSSIRPI